MQQELPKEVGGQGKIEDGALETAGGLATGKPMLGKSPFCHSLSSVTLGHFVSEPQSPHLHSKGNNICLMIQ